MAGTSNSITTHNVLSGVLNADNVISGLVNTAFNPAYALVTQAGAQIVLFINNNDYKMYAQLKDKSGNLIYTSNIIDLPLETMVVAGRYDSNTKKLILVLDNGNEIEIPLGALISGLVNEDDLEANYYDKNEIDTLLEGYWTKIEITQEDIDNWNAKQEYLNQGDGIEISAETTLKGNTSQESTTGKNLFDISKVVSNWNSSTNIGVRNNNDGTLTVSTPSTSSSVQALVPNKLSDYCPSLQVGDKVYITATTTGTQKYVYLTTSASVWSFGALRTISQNDLDSSVLWYSSGVSATATISDIMISTSGGDYEPYTGGNPAPNPDYPYPVNVVTGDNEIKFEGKNLIPNTLASGSSNGITYTVNSDGSIKLSGTATARVEPYLYKDNNNPITFKAGTYRNTSSKIMILYANGYILAPPNQAFTLDEDKNVINIYFRIENGETVNETYYPQIILNSTTDTSYEPYQSQTYPINLGSMELCKIGDYQDYIAKSTGKNLFDESLLTGITMNGITWSTENNKIKISGTSTSTYSQSGNTSINLQKGTYYFVKSGTTSLTYNAWLYNRDGTLIANTKLNNPFTINETATRIVLFVEGLTNGTSYNQEMNFMVSTKSGETYEPYGKVWYKYGAIGKVVLDGSEDWTKSASMSVDGYFGAYTTNYHWGIAGAFANKNNFIINYFLSHDNITGDFQFISSTGYACYLKINDSIVNSVETLKTWLSTHNTQVYYVLATPTTTQITDTTLIEQLDNLSIGLSNKWIKNISQTNAEIPFELEYDNTNLTISANLSDYYTKTETNTLLNDKVGFTDYANYATAGVVKSNLSFETDNNGGARCSIIEYSNYPSANNRNFISKGTLENVLTAKIGDIQTLLDNLNTGSGV